MSIQPKLTKSRASPSQDEALRSNPENVRESVELGYSEKNKISLAYLYTCKTILKKPIHKRSGTSRARRASPLSRRGRILPRRRKSQRGHSSRIEIHPNHCQRPSPRKGTTYPEVTPEMLISEHQAILASEDQPSGPSRGEVDLVIGWVAPVGTEVSTLSTYISEKLQANRKGYIAQEFKVIEAIKRQVEKNLPLTSDFDSADYRRRTIARQNAGNWLRRRTHSGILAGFVVAAIKKFRESNPTARKRLTLVQSLKHPQEAIVLRQVYGPAFFLIGVHNSFTERHDYLRGRCDDSGDAADELIGKDAHEGLPYGQQTRDLFELCDAYIDKTDGANEEIDRILDLMFGKIDIVPRLDEYAMAEAYRAAERSGDLARQVGAAIVSATGELIATGRNDVPKPDGDVYSVGQEFDGSDYALGYDSGQKYRDDLIEELATTVLKKVGRYDRRKLHPRQKEEVYKDRLRKLTSLLGQSRLKDIVEFGRSVHAEMNALTTCCRKGLATAGSTIYVTTFPCHTCARHIIAAGIKKCVYVEPYPKSQALKLHSDSICCPALGPGVLRKVNGEVLRVVSDGAKVQFVPLVGISPRRFSDFFSLRTYAGDRIERKSEGLAQRYVNVPEGEEEGGTLKVAPWNEGLFTRERQVGQWLLDLIPGKH